MKFHCRCYEKVRRSLLFIFPSAKGQFSSGFLVKSSEDELVLLSYNRLLHCVALMVKRIVFMSIVSIVPSAVADDATVCI